MTQCRMISDIKRATTIADAEADVSTLEVIVTLGDGGRGWGNLPVQKRK